MIRIKRNRRGKCLSCGEENDVLNVMIGRTEQAMVGVEICHKCLLDTVVKSDLKILEFEQMRKSKIEKSYK